MADRKTAREARGGGIPTTPRKLPPEVRDRVDAAILAGETIPQITSDLRRSGYTVRVDSLGKYARGVRRKAGITNRRGRPRRAVLTVNEVAARTRRSVGHTRRLCADKLAALGLAKKVKGRWVVSASAEPNICDGEAREAPKDKGKSVSVGAFVGVLIFGSADAVARAIRSAVRSEGGLA
jgi:hypothetical protein